MTARSAGHVRAAPTTPHDRVDGRCDNLTTFALWLPDTHPEIERIGQLRRHHLEDFLVFNRTRLSRSRARRGTRISAGHAAHNLSDLEMFFDDLTLWGWGRCPRPAAPPPHRLSCPPPGRSAVHRRGESHVRGQPTRFTNGDQSAAWIK